MEFCENVKLNLYQYEINCSCYIKVKKTPSPFPCPMKNWPLFCNPICKSYCQKIQSAILILRDGWGEKNHSIPRNIYINSQKLNSWFSAFPSRNLLIQNHPWKHQDNLQNCSKFSKIRRKIQTVKYVRIQE